MNIVRIIWWLALIVLVLACAGAVAITAWAYRGEEHIFLDYAAATRPDASNVQQSVETNAARFKRVVLCKDWLINHGILGSGITAIVILFSCLSLFLLTTCLVERRGNLPKSPLDVPACKTDIATTQVVSVVREAHEKRP